MIFRTTGLAAGCAVTLLGLTQAPMTGQLTAAMVCGSPRPIDITPYSLDRF